jgi:hypothetical protein
MKCALSSAWISWVDKDWEDVKAVMVAILESTMNS